MEIISYGRPLRLVLEGLCRARGHAEEAAEFERRSDCSQQALNAKQMEGRHRNGFRSCMDNIDCAF